MPSGLVAIPCDVKAIGLHPYHVVGEKYIDAVSSGAGCVPVLLPALGEGRDLRPVVENIDLEALLRDFDGLFLTGSQSNVNPSNYDDALQFKHELIDSQRDRTTLELIRVALYMGVPLLAVCRGIQELNVSLGGNLYQHVHDVVGLMDHREDDSLPRAEQYRPVHDIDIVADGLLHRLYGTTRARVNSLHGQGLNELGERIVVEATAPDGLVEAVSVRDARSFALGVQWHPEWRHWEDPLSSALLEAFGDAVRQRAASLCPRH